MTETHRSPRFIIVGFDGLRPVDATDDQMPNVARFAREHHTWTKYLASFPTETYVNHPSIFSGFRPKDHGVIQNWFYRQGVPKEALLFRGSSMDSVLAADALDRGCCRVPSMGERLAGNGMRMRVYCANSAGSTRLQHVRAERFEGHCCVPVHDLARTVPESEIERLRAAGVPGAPLTFPDFDGNRMTVDAFLQLDAARGPQALPEVAVVWIGEPDHSEHEFGLDDPRTIEARRDADRQFGRILDWWERTGKDEDVQLIVMSDHGHGVVRRHVDVAAPLRNAGFTVVDGFGLKEGKNPADYDVVMVGNYTVGVWFREPTAANMLRARDALMVSPDVGLVFSKPDATRPGAVEGRVPGTFSEAVVFSDHERTPDMRFVMRGDVATGELVMGEELPLNAGNHGGLLPQEIRSFLAVGGKRFPGSGVHHEPAGHDDLAVTVMTMLGVLDDEAELPLPTGRTLTEAVRAEGGKPECACASYDAANPVREVLSLSCGAFTQRITREVWAGRSYVVEGTRVAADGDDGWTPRRGLHGFGSAGTMSGTGPDDAASGPNDNPTQTPKKEA